MESPLISIIVPVYNLEKELPRCLNSILVQTYSNIEIIVVDDGSKDNSLSVMNSYAKMDARIKVVAQKNGGVTSARLHGVREAHGSWIGFADGDDVIEPDMYERLLKNALQYCADISHCGYQMCFEDGRIRHFHNTGLIQKMDCVESVKELLSGKVIEPGLWNKLYRAELMAVLLNNGMMEPSIKINEDLLMNYILFLSARHTVFEDWCPYHYIVRSTSASRAKWDQHKIYDPIWVKDIIYKSATAEIKNDAKRAYINTCMNVYQGLLGAGTEYRADMQKIRSLIAQEKRSFGLLGKKRAIMAWLIIIAPVLFKPVYLIYKSYFQKRVYS